MIDTVFVTHDAVECESVRSIKRCCERSRGRVSKVPYASLAQWIRPGRRRRRSDLERPQRVRSRLAFSFEYATRKDDSQPGSTLSKDHGFLAANKAAGHRPVWFSASGRVLAPYFGRAVRQTPWAQNA